MDAETISAHRETAIWMARLFVHSALEVLTTMTGTSAEPKEVFSGSNYDPTADVSAVIGILGDDEEIMATFSFTNALAKRLVGNMLGIAADNVSRDELSEGIGEISNMIAGSAKRTVSTDRNGMYHLSLPSVVMGANHKVSKPKNRPCMVLVLETEGERCHMLLSYKLNP